MVVGELLCSLPGLGHPSIPPFTRKLYVVEPLEFSTSTINPEMPVLQPQTKSHTTSLPGTEAFGSVSTTTPAFLFLYAAAGVLWKVRSQVNAGFK